MIALIDTLDHYGMLGPGPAFFALGVLILAYTAGMAPSLPTTETNQ